MKRHIIFLLALSTFSLKSQTKAGYHYDNNGNRYQRYFIGLKQSVPEDTASAPADSVLHTIGQEQTLQEEQKTVLDKGVSVYPNPTQNIVTVSISSGGMKESKKAQMYLIDNNGRLLDTKNYSGTDLSFDLIKSPPGNYFLKIVFDTKETLTYSVIKVN